LQPHSQLQAHACRRKVTVQRTHSEGGQETKLTCAKLSGSSSSSSSSANACSRDAAPIFTVVCVGARSRGASSSMPCLLSAAGADATGKLHKGHSVHWRQHTQTRLGAWEARRHGSGQLWQQRHMLHVLCHASNTNLEAIGTATPSQHPRNTLATPPQALIIARQRGQIRVGGRSNRVIGLHHILGLDVHELLEGLATGKRSARLAASAQVQEQRRRYLLGSSVIFSASSVILFACSVIFQCLLPFSHARATHTARQGTRAEWPIRMPHLSCSHAASHGAAPITPGQGNWCF